MASVRSALPYEQAGFVPEAGTVLPQLPTPGWKVRDTLRVATKLGCSIVLTGATELRIGHPLSEASEQVVHSAHRNDTSRALVGFLRKIKERILQSRQGPRQLASSAGAVNGSPQPVHHLSHKLHAQGIVEKVKEDFKDLQEEVEVFKEAAMKLERESAELRKRAEAPPHQPEREVLDLPPADPRFITAAEAVARDMGSIIQQIHYRSHCDDVNFRGFHECQNAVCTRARAAMEEVRKLGLVAAGLEQKNRQLKEAETVLFDEMAALEKRLGETGEKPAASVASSPTDVTMPAAEEAKMAVNYPDAVWILPGDDMNTRSEKYEMMTTIFEHALKKRWKNDLGVLTRAMVAISQMIRQDSYDPKYQVAFKVCNWLRFREKLMNQRRPGGVRLLLGRGGWMDLVTACETLRTLAGYK